MFWADLINGRFESVLFYSHPHHLIPISSSSRSASSKRLRRRSMLGAVGWRKGFSRSSIAVSTLRKRAIASLDVALPPGKETDSRRTPRTPDVIHRKMVDLCGRFPRRPGGKRRDASLHEISDSLVMSIIINPSIGFCETERRPCRSLATRAKYMAYSGTPTMHAQQRKGHTIGHILHTQGRTQHTQGHTLAKKRKSPVMMPGLYVFWVSWLRAYVSGAIFFNFSRCRLIAA